MSETTNIAKLKPEEPAKLPTLTELFEDSLEVAGKSEGLNAILNVNPPDKWVKNNPYAHNSKYLPIDRVEYLLRRIFKRFNVEITGQGTAFNGVWVTIRLHYFNPAIGTMDYSDGIGSTQLQTKSGTSPADLLNINDGAISMAFPIAKTEAIKDAAHLIGNIFGANLNRKDPIQFEPDNKLLNKYAKAMGEPKTEKL